jgi:hypothetical protein
MIIIEAIYKLLIEVLFNNLVEEENPAINFILFNSAEEVVANNWTCVINYLITH